MVKENHVQKTVVMPTALEERLIAYVQEMNKMQREAGMPKNQQTKGSQVICFALDAHLKNIGDHYKSGDALNALR
jgi:hypothetical protein